MTQGISIATGCAAGATESVVVRMIYNQYFASILGSPIFSSLHSLQ
jgi:hypothetical protein